MAFREWLLTRLPGANRGDRGELFVAILAGRFDELVARAKVAAKVDLPDYAPDDALPHLAADRQVTRMPGEDITTWRARVDGAWEAWSWACTDRGLRSVVLLAGLGAPTFYAQRALPRPPRPVWWARFTVVFSGRATWDALPWDGAWTWDGRVVAPIEALSDAEVRARLRGLLAPWKSARDRITSVIVARGGSLWDTGERWDAGWTWDAGDGWTEIAAPPFDSTPWDAGWCWDYFL